MEITTVHYQKLVNLGDYQNERVGAWANVGAEETAERALEHLTEWVLARIESLHSQIEEERSLERTIEDRRYALHELEANIAAAQKRWDRIVKWFADRQIDLPSRWSHTDDVPF